MTVGFFGMIGPWELLVLLIMGLGVLVTVLVVVFVIVRSSGKPLIRCACGALNPVDRSQCSQCGAQLTPPRPGPPNP